ncbi:hypothetical protein XENOCAPTIV_017041, partial [Xenoophorus captivus]
ANVYHASTAAGDGRAIKIYKTSILLFKDRDKYVSGEFRPVWFRVCSDVGSVFPDFFVKHGVAVLTVRELFDFVTDPSITSRNIEQYLDKVFKMAYIPRTLTEVTHYERDVELMRLKEEESAISGHHDNVLYQTLTGLKKDLSGVQMVRFFSFCLCCWSNTS